MPDESNPFHGVMESGGFYNKHAKIQASGVSLALALFENAARSIVAGPSDEPIVIGDYGSSQGKNSLIPMRVAIENLRTTFGPNRPIFVFHVDQPSNDFNTLFGVLDSDPDRYIVSDPQVFPSAIGRTFYERVLPVNHVHLGWSSYAAVWLSHIPTLIPGHFFGPRSAGAVRKEFDRQGAKDWEAFLSFRASELRPGGRLVIVLPGINEDGSPGFMSLMDHANDALAEMVSKGVISADERARMVLGSYPRRTSALLAPFAKDGQFHQLVVESCETFANPDAAWNDFMRDGDAEMLAARHTLFFRSTFAPSLATALASARHAEERRAFADRLEDELKRRLAEDPRPYDALVQVVALVKQD